MTFDPKIGTFSLTSTNGVTLEDFRERWRSETDTEGRIVRPGEFPTKVSALSREIELRLHIRGSTVAELRTRKAGLLNAAGNGEEVVVQIEDDREIRARRISLAQEVERASTLKSDAVSLGFLATDPYWRKKTLSTFHRDVTATGLNGPFTITNSSDTFVWPDLKIASPTTAFVNGTLIVRNVTRGEEFQIAKLSIPTTKTLKIEGLTGLVTDTTGALAATGFSPELVDPLWWRLNAAGNSVEIEIFHSGAINLDFDWEWFDRYHHR